MSSGSDDAVYKTRNMSKKNKSKKKETLRSSSTSDDGPFSSLIKNPLMKSIIKDAGRDGVSSLHLFTALDKICTMMTANGDSVNTLSHEVRSVKDEILSFKNDISAKIDQVSQKAENALTRCMALEEKMGFDPKFSSNTSIVIKGLKFDDQEQGNEDGTVLKASVSKLFDSMGITEFSIEHLERATLRPQNKNVGNGTAARAPQVAIVKARMSSAAQKISVLKAKKELKDTQYKGVFIESFQDRKQLLEMRNIKTVLKVMNKKPVFRHDGSIIKIVESGNKK